MAYLSADGVRVGLLLVMAVAQVAAGQAPQLFGWEETIGSRSDALSTPIVPPGWAFAIWGVIFLGCLVFAVYAALPGNLTNPLLRRIGWLAVMAFALNTLWELWVPVYSLDAVALGILGVLLVVMVIVMMQIAAAAPLTTGTTWFVRFPLSLLAGWITAAFFVGLSVTARFYGIAFEDGTGLVPSLVVLTAASLFAAGVLFSGAGWMYAIGVVWGLAAIAIGTAASGGALALAGLAAAAALVLALLALTRA